MNKSKLDEMIRESDVIKTGLIRRNEILTFIIFSLSLLLCAAIRMPNLPFLEGKNVFDPDSARYLRQAKLIVEQGAIPIHDTMRWVPAGVDINARLTFFPYILAYVYRFFTFLGLPITIEKVAIFSPIFFSAMSMLFLYLLISKVLDRHTALLSINVSAVSFPWVVRTVTGYSDWGLWDNFLSPLGQSRLFSFIGELQKQGLTQWISWPGFFFIFITIGLFMIAKRFAMNLNSSVPLGSSR